MSKTKGLKNNITTKSQEELEREWLDFASDSFVGESLKFNKSQSLTNLTKAQINQMLLNPQQNYEKLQNVSQLYITKSGIYKRLIEYFSYLLTFDTLLIPQIETSLIKNKSKVSKSFENGALYLEKLNPKTILPTFSKELFTSGEVYAYKIEDKKSIEHKLIPQKYCVPYYKQEGVQRFVIDMQKFATSEDYTSFPTEIQKACELYNTGKSKDKFIGGQYYEVSNKGVCFTFNKMGGHAIPPFANIFIDLINLDDNKELQSQVDKLENTKMIHNKIPLNKDSKPIVDPSLAQKYNQAIKNNLDDGIFSIVNPFDTGVLNLNNNSQRTTSLVSEAIAQIFNNSGVSDLLFNNQKASGEALKKSIIVDAMNCLATILPMFTDWLTWEVSNAKSTDMLWKCIVLPFTYFDREEIRTKAVNELAYGGSRSYYLASCGFTPLQGLNLLQMEQVMGIDRLFVPAQSSHTTSNTSVNNGRPTNSSKGETISEITDTQNETQ